MPPPPPASTSPTSSSSSSSAPHEEDRGKASSPGDSDYESGKDVKAGVPARVRPGGRDSISDKIERSIIGFFHEPS